MSALTCSSIFSPVIQGIVVTGFFFWKLQGSAIWSTKDGFTLENPPSMTVVSFLPEKQKAPGLERLCCSSSVYICFWKVGTCFASVSSLTKQMSFSCLCSLFVVCFQDPTWKGTLDALIISAKYSCFVWGLSSSWKQVWLQGNVFFQEYLYILLLSLGSRESK